MSAKTLEKEYVHAVYSRLASYIQKKETGNGHRIWPNVTKFLDALPKGSCVIDIGQPLSLFPFLLLSLSRMRRSQIPPD